MRLRRQKGSMEGGKEGGEGKTRVSIVNEGAGPWEGHFALRPHGRLFVQQLMCPAEEVAGAAWAPSQE